MGFGTRFKASPRAALMARATPPSGASPEAIWHQAYDTQLFTSGTTTRLTYFQTTSTDATISNMQSAGQFPDPYWLALYDITFDFLNDMTSVVNVDQSLGVIDDIQKLLLTQRGIWTLTISDKNYGPYSLSTLHGTGGAVGFLDSGNTAATGNGQYAQNALNPGWNYYGTILIPPKTSFKIEVVWAATSTLQSGNTNLRLSLFGVLSRRVL